MSVAGLECGTDEILRGALPAGNRLTLVWASACGWRANLEDAVGVVQVRQSPPEGEEFVVAAVCDGAGGCEAGEIASSIGSATIPRHAASVLLATGDTNDADHASAALRAAVVIANERIVRRAAHDRSCASMASTVVCATDVGNRLCVAWVGDSRAYLVCAHSLTRVTEDHTKVAALVEAGELTAAQARVHPEAHILTRWLGCAGGVEVATCTLPIEPGNVTLLCTDGLSNALTDDELARLLVALRREDVPFAAWADRMVADALAAGADDNVTALCWRYESLNGATNRTWKADRDAGFALGNACMHGTECQRGGA